MKPTIIGEINQSGLRLVYYERPEAYGPESNLIYPPFLTVYAWSDGVLTYKKERE